MIKHTFPHDSTAVFNDVPLAGMTFSGVVAETRSELSKKLYIDFDTNVGLTPRRSAPLVIAADTSPELLEHARREVCNSLRISETHGIAFPAEYIVRRSAAVIALGRVVDASSSELPCTVRVEQRHGDLRHPSHNVFAVVDHPVHGKIAVSPVEFLALGLPEAAA